MAAPRVYDKAKYHYGGNYPKDLPKEQAFVHTGMFLGWLIDHVLCSEDFYRESHASVEAFKRREKTGTQIYVEWDGALVEDMLSEDGNAFARHYFDFQTGRYLKDYEVLVGAGLPSLYHVQDTWDNYQAIARRIDQRYAQWMRQRRKRWWEFWV